MHAVVFVDVRCVWGPHVKTLQAAGTRSQDAQVHEESEQEGGALMSIGAAGGQRWGCCHRRTGEDDELSPSLQGLGPR